MVCRAVQFLKVQVAIVVTELGMPIDESDEQLANALLFNFVKLVQALKSRLVSLAEDEKAYFSTLLTLLGISKVVSSAQWLIADSLMVIRFDVLEK